MRKKRKGISLKAIERFFLNNPAPLSLREIYKKINPRPKDKAKIKAQLKSLQDEGKIVALGHKRYIQVTKLPKIQGKMELVPTPRGDYYGFVCPDQEGLSDVFIGPEHLQGAWPNDQVQVAILPEKKGKNPEGIVIRILQRGYKKMLATITHKLNTSTFLVRPEEKNFNRPLVAHLDKGLVPDQHRHSLGPGILVQISLQWPNRENPDQPGRTAVADPQARIKKILGPELDLRAQEALVIAKYDLPGSFSRTVHDQARDIAHLARTALQRDDFLQTDPLRMDLQTLPFVTIDGPRAKDFDDAITVRKKGNRFELWVAIADVAHFVLPGSVLDLEARGRGNSFYFPTQALPMFPEELSNDLCSLKPEQIRPVLVCQQQIDLTGEVLSGTFYPALIKSRARLTYDQVQAALDEDNQQGQIPNRELFSMLKEASQLATLLRKKRIARGSLDFDLPEAEILLEQDTGKISFQVTIQNQAQQIIEEFMLAANEAVAAFLTAKEIPFLYRIHEPPDQKKLETLFQTLQRSGLYNGQSHDGSPLALQSILKQKSMNEELSFLVHRLLLRSMMQAAYSPKNKGHFGLASSCYTHFTSPIRRYADLIVHRALRQALGGEHGHTYPPSELERIAQGINAQERLAMEAEREIVKRSAILYLLDKTGAMFTGTVSSLSDFGYWVELDGLLCEGMIRLADLDDFFLYLPEKNMLLGQHTGKQITIGQRIKTKLISADLQRLEIDLAPVSK